MALALGVWSALERRYRTHQRSGTPRPDGSGPMEVASPSKRTFQRLAHFRFLCGFGSSISGSIELAAVEKSCRKVKFSDVGGFFYRHLGVCPHGPKSGGRALTRAMTKNTERQRARLKARARCHSGKQHRLRDIIVRPKTLKTHQVSASKFLLFCSDHFGRWPQSYIDLDLCLCTFIHVWEEGDPKSWALNAISAMAHFMPAVRGKTPGSSRLMKVWTKRSFLNGLRLCPLCSLRPLQEPRCADMT